MMRLLFLYFHVTKIKIISSFSMTKYCEYFDFVNINHSVANSNAWANQPALVQLYVVGLKKRFDKCVQSPFLIFYIYIYNVRKKRESF